MWKTKTKPYLHNHFDSRRWNKITLREGDIIVTPYLKSGTTREQMTLLQIIHGGKNNLNITELSPYIELCIEPIEEILKRIENQTKIRVLKAHLPIDYLPYNKQVKYIDVWRNPFDIAVSLYNHHNKANKNYFNKINENRPIGTQKFNTNDLNQKDWILRWFKTDGFPYWSFSKHIIASWKYKDLTNVKIFHYADLSNSIENEIMKRAKFLNININNTLLQKIIYHSSFNYMKRHSKLTAPYGGIIWGEGSGKEFFRKGKDGDWKEILSKKDIQYCKNLIFKRLPTNCIEWLMR